MAYGADFQIKVDMMERDTLELLRIEERGNLQSTI